MARAFLVVIDSVGIGGAPDAAQFFNGDVPDTGANTLGHIAQWCEQERGRPLDLPVMAGLGLGRAIEAASGMTVPALEAPLAGAWGFATEVSPGKDTPSGHWELAGLPVPWDWHYFPDKQDSFPPDLLAAVCAAAGSAGTLGNCHASGTEIIARLGEEHQRTGWPICYTSADSVFQIAAHEDSFGLDRLLDLCRTIAPMLHEMRVGRVIARPFVGTPGQYARTGNRRDFAITPPGPVLTNRVQDAGGHVYGVGKIGDIFSMTGIDEVRKGDDAALLGHLHDLARTAVPGSLTFANIVEFDSLYGHRRDPGGYAAHLEWFDMQIGGVLDLLGPDDLLVITADHGNDPTWLGTDHTRERVPVLAAGMGPRALGGMAFTDVAQLVAAHLGA
ncbi:phosphopentomutase [Aliishimia ponticola]|uniref:Phosphopentomutase n=1 Tax=Aliishimia ponticola TaxID=2499833 RepID=A0A4V3XKI1_9RHOB|nr:phosphopentomutase [Aliishimia ponticola]THH37093.1 phosphopentomutase [Aliishimia ponticola]